jgi:hypothetical protein
VCNITKAIINVFLITFKFICIACVSEITLLKTALRDVALHHQKCGAADAEHERLRLELQAKALRESVEETRLKHLESEYVDLKQEVALEQEKAVQDYQTTLADISTVNADLKKLREQLLAAEASCSVVESTATSAQALVDNKRELEKQASLASADHGFQKRLSIDVQNAVLVLEKAQFELSQTKAALATIKERILAAEQTLSHLKDDAKRQEELKASIERNFQELSASIREQISETANKVTELFDELQNSSAIYEMVTHGDAVLDSAKQSLIMWGYTLPVGVDDLILPSVVHGVYFFLGFCSVWNYYSQWTLNQQVVTTCDQHTRLLYYLYFCVFWFAVFSGFDLITFIAAIRAAQMHRSQANWLILPLWGHVVLFPVVVVRFFCFDADFSGSWW